MSVTRIIEYRNRDTIAALEDLLARARGGHLRGVAFTIKTSANQHRLGLTGAYWDNPHEVLMCAVRLSHIVNELISSRDTAAPSRTMPL